MSMNDLLNDLFEGFAEVFAPDEIKRQKALDWWHSLDYMSQVSWSLNTAHLRSGYHMPQTDEEIEQIYLIAKGEQ